MESLPQFHFEFIFVNDGSSDRTLTILQAIQCKDSRVSVIDLSRNFGKEAAMLAGMDHMNTDALVIMDADLQDSPELIPQMISWWQQGYDDVYAKRSSRSGETMLKRWTSHVYYRVLQKISSLPVQPDAGDFRLLDRKCVEALKRLRESQRYTKGLFSWIGFKKKEIVFDRPARAAGKTKWNYWKLCNLALDGITSFTTAPLRGASVIGCLLAFIAAVYMMIIIGKTILYGNNVAGYPSLISVVLFIGGIQLFFMGILGEYLGRIFNESKERPVYLVKDYKQAREVKKDAVHQ
jgi:glycosyltransferase involved in cell wall biosynthesis